MQASSSEQQTLALTMNPKLDQALQSGWEAWEAAAREAGTNQVAGWLAQRQGDAGLKRSLLEPVQNLLQAEDPEDRALARTDLAELLEGEDDPVADALWEGVLAYGRETEDPDVILEATSHLAAIGEGYGDPLAAAEYWLDFLNWRRQPSHSSDPEAVETAFDEVIRLARLDGDQRAAALLEYRQAGYTRLLDAEDDRATEGDWEKDPAPYESWA